MPAEPPRILDVPLPWRVAHTRGQRAHPRVVLPIQQFVAAPLGSVPPAAADFYLAQACDAGVEGSWERLESRYRKPMHRFLRRRGAATDEAHAVVDDTLGSLATPPPRGGARTRIGTYDGRGSLKSWLSTVAWRRLIDTWRARRGSQDVQDDTVVGGGRRFDPALHVSREETARLIGQGLEEAWSEMTSRELQAVVLKYRHHLPQTEIARILRVGPPRVSRMLQSATMRMREAIVRRFDRQSDWEVGGAGWDALLATLERMLARAEADVDDTMAGGTAGG